MATYRRFDAANRVLHAFLMFSFLGLSATGLPLLFGTSRWAAVLERLLGGIEMARGLHRLSATVLILVFLVHLARVLRQIVVDRDLSALWGPGSMVPQPRDFVQAVGHVKWFLGLGPRPKFGRYSYWEKFDYWAVFWGMGIIGVSGLVLWFPTFFSRFLSGRMFNIALLIHGEEALLAVVFIFTVHFFNTHMRPEKFPMDPVIFTGRLSEQELREERPGEYDQLVAKGGLAAIEVGPPNSWIMPSARVLAAVVVSVGFVVVILIVLTLAQGRG
jgi:cytochrome b subunit of formate dehydrogenase